MASGVGNGAGLNEVNRTEYPPFVPHLSTMEQYKSKFSHVQVPIISSPWGLKGVFSVLSEGTGMVLSLVLVQVT